MNVQTTSTSNNGSVIKSNQEPNTSNESSKSNNNSNTAQPAQHPQSQLEITGVSRSSHPVTSQKESNRFRIVKTDADRKNEPVDENSPQVAQPSEQNLSHSNLQKNTTDPNHVNAKNVFNNYQRGRWFVAEFSTENFPQAKSSNQPALNGSAHAGQINIQSQTKNDESTNFTPNQSNTININDKNKVLNHAQSNAPVQNQSQPGNNPGTNTNYYLNNQVYSQSTQTPAQTYQILNQASSSNFSQSAQKLNPTASNNLVSNSSQTTRNQNPNQNNQSNAAINNPHTDNTQSHIQQNFPSQGQNQSANVPSMNVKENISVGTQANTQITAQQASPKDQNLVKLVNGVNSGENLAHTSTDSEAASNETEAIKADTGIHDKIAEAMDIMKSHLTQAVRDEIVTLKNQIKNLKEQCNRLEQQNRLLKTNMPSDIMRQLENMGIFSYNTSINGMSENDNRTQDNMLSSFTEKVMNKNDFLNNL